jgi:hypothetical protein
MISDSGKLAEPTTMAPPGLADEDEDEESRGLPDEQPARARALTAATAARAIARVLSDMVLRFLVMG